MAKATDQQDRDDMGQLRDQVTVLRQQLESLAMAVSVSTGLDSIGKGLADLVEEFVPLRQLVPPRTGDDLPAPVVIALRGLRASLRTPQWAAVQSLDVDEWDVGYIAQADPPRGRTDQGYPTTPPSTYLDDVTAYPEGTDLS